MSSLSAPMTLPKLRISERVTNINDVKFEDFILEGYESHPTIKAKVSVWQHLQHFGHLFGVWASYMVLKTLCRLKKVRLLAIGSWFIFICYLIACSYDDFENDNKNYGHKYEILKSAWRKVTRTRYSVFCGYWLLCTKWFWRIILPRTFLFLQD